jgi:hypothetical protein
MSGAIDGMREKAVGILETLKGAGVEVGDLTEALPFVCAAVFTAYGDEAEEVMSLFFKTTRACMDLLRLEANITGLLEGKKD